MTPNRASGLRVLALLFAGTAAAYLALLGWDQTAEVDPATHSQTGPYGAWQVVALVVLLFALGVWAAAQRAPHMVFAVPAVLTVCWTVDAVTDGPGDGLRPIGALFVATGSFVVAGLLLAVSHPLRMLSHRETRSAWLRHRWWRASQRGLALTLLRAGAGGGSVGLIGGEWDGRFLTHALTGAALAGSGEALLYLSGRPSRRSSPGGAG